MFEWLSHLCRYLFGYLPKLAQASSSLHRRVPFVLCSLPLAKSGFWYLFCSDQAMFLNRFCGSGKAEKAVIQRQPGKFKLLYSTCCGLRQNMFVSIRAAELQIARFSQCLKAVRTGPVSGPQGNHKFWNEGNNALEHSSVNAVGTRHITR